MIEVNGDRLWASLMSMARIGATEAGGVRRLALSPQDREARDLFVSWCREAGLTIRVDAMGNIFARRAGREANAKAVLVGSHLDSQPKGGRFDGPLGVLAALELVRTLNDHKIETDAPVEIVNWTNEEGARFTPSMLGSAVFAGKRTLRSTLDITDTDNVSIEEALAACGYDGDDAVSIDEFDAYFEAHIEQGPILEAAGNQIGIVTGGQAIRWLDVVVEGAAAHAGTTPMDRRKDAFFAAAEMALELEALAARKAPSMLATIGQLAIANASRNTIAGEIEFSVDIRHPEDEVLDDIESAIRKLFGEVACKRKLQVTLRQYLNIPATPFDELCVSSVRRAAQQAGYSSRPIISGAGHDAINLATCLPSAMVFIPCVGGLSHNEAEDALPKDVFAGANVLLHAVLDRARVAT